MLRIVDVALGAAAALPEQQARSRALLIRLTVSLAFALIVIALVPVARSRASALHRQFHARAARRPAAWPGPFSCQARKPANLRDFCRPAQSNKALDITVMYITLQHKPSRL